MFPFSWSKKSYNTFFVVLNILFQSRLARIAKHQRLKASDMENGYRTAVGMGEVEIIVRILWTALQHNTAVGLSSTNHTQELSKKVLRALC